MIPPRNRWAIAGGVALAAVALVGGVVLLTSQTKSPASCVTPATASSATPASAASAAGGGGLRVTEKGFSQYEPILASVGGIVENTSSQVAYRTQITFRLTDATHASAVPEKSGELLRLEIPVIRPGEKIPVGTWTYLREAESGKAVTVADLQIELGTTQWLPAGGFAPIMAEQPQLTRSSADPQTATIKYALTSDYCSALHARGVAMVFRNSSGKIVGGSFEADRSPSRCQPGDSNESANAQRSVPSGIDETKTQVLTYCDVAPAAAASPGGPVN
jgi:hypothetical protein